MSGQSSTVDEVRPWNGRGGMDFADLRVVADAQWKPVDSRMIRLIAQAYGRIRISGAAFSPFVRWDT